LGLAGVLVVGQVETVRPFLNFIDYGGMIDQTAQIAQSFPEDAVLLFENSFESGRVAAPLWRIHGLTVFMLEEGAISDPDIIPALEYWWANGRDVFWLGSGSDSPVLAGNVAANYEGTRTWTLFWAERPANHLPQQTGLFLHTVDVHRLRTWDTGEQQAVTTIPIAQEPVKADVVPTWGLYDVRQYPGLAPRRWTSGQVTIEIPVSAGLTQISLMMGNGRPASIPAAAVSVYLNETYLDTVRVKGISKVYNIAIPPEIDLGAGTAELRLEMEPWIPAETGYNTDQRQLGVYLDWIKLITVETKPE
jgi:hypothetical protein